MRLFLLPISTRRSLIYCEKLHEKAPKDRSIFDKVSIKANETWAAWEKDEKAVGNWKKKVTFYGNQALKRIPYEEWGLKTLPALTDRRKQDIIDGKAKHEILFPGRYLKQERVTEILSKLAQERQGMHRSKLIWSVVIMPFTAPFMLVPVIPNLPFFYVLYRAWSHWKGISSPKPKIFVLFTDLRSTHRFQVPRIPFETQPAKAESLMGTRRSIHRRTYVPHPQNLARCPKPNRGGR